MDRVPQAEAEITIAEVEIVDEYDRPYSQLARWVGSLVTPHPSRRQEATPIKDRINIDETREMLDIATISGEEERDEMRVEIAGDASRAVNLALVFWPGRQDERTNHLVRPSLEQLSSEQKANCYGFTLVTSSLLEKIGVEHSIGFANGHAFIVLFTGKGERTTAWLFDSVEPAFNQDMAGLNPTINFEGVREQMEDSGRGITVISTRNFAPHLNRDVQDLVEEGHWRWLMHKPKAGEALTEAEAFERHAQLTLSIYEMAEGRKALENNLGYLNARATGNWASAIDYLGRMDGRYPELDPNSIVHEWVPKLIEEACKAGVDRHKIAAALEAYASSFGSNMPENIARLQGECWEHIERLEQGAAGIQAYQHSYGA